jgi:hypothetical protein
VNFESRCYSVAPTTKVALRGIVNTPFVHRCIIDVVVDVAVFSIRRFDEGGLTVGLMR